MGRSSRKFPFVVGIAGVTLFGLAILFLGLLNAEEKSMIDFTLNMDGEIAENGGMVTVILRPDPELEPDETPMQITVTSQMSVVIIDHAKGQDYNYRFANAVRPNAKTERFSVGTYKMGPDLNASVLYHHIDVGQPDWDLDKSHRLTYVLVASSVEDEHPCRNSKRVKVCDASSLLNEPLPE